MHLDQIHPTLRAEISAALRYDGHGDLADGFDTADITHSQPVATFYTQYFFSHFTALQIAKEGKRHVVNTPSLGLVEIRALADTPAMIEVLDRPDDDFRSFNDSSCCCM